MPVDVEEQKELNLSLRSGAETGWSLLDGRVSRGPNGAADRKGRVNLWNESDENHRTGLNPSIRDVLLGTDVLVTWRLQIS